MNGSIKQQIPDQARALLEEQCAIYRRANRRGLRASDAARLEILHDELRAVFAPDAPPDPGPMPTAVAVAA